MAAQNKRLDEAVSGHGSEGKRHFLEKAFAFAFKGLVYAQIWEDPVVDMAALDLQPDSRVITIASGGCNVLSYLVADPAQIVAVDLNTAHVALIHLKIAAAKHLDADEFHRFFAQAADPANVHLYHEKIALHLDDTSRRYWEGRDIIGRRRIGGFKSGVYKRGLLGNFIGMAHIVAKLYRIDPRILLSARTLAEQRTIFETKLSPIFDRRFVRWITDQPASLFGLGIPPAQFDVLAGNEKMADVLRKRLEKLACDFPLSDNYFAWQAFGRCYGEGPAKPLPPYLKPENFAALRDRVGRIDLRHANVAELLASEPAESFDRYILLDAQDWMSDAQLDTLWSDITRTAKPGARVLFRTAAEPTLLPGRVASETLARWDYREADSLRYTAEDRSSIYGGVHLYVLKDR